MLNRFIFAKFTLYDLIFKLNEDECSWFELKQMKNVFINDSNKSSWTNVSNKIMFTITFMI